MKKLILAVILAFIVNCAFSQIKTDSLNTSILKTSFRVKFDEVFITNANGSITPKYKTQIGGVIMGPGGVAFQQGVIIAGLDIPGNKGHDILIDTVKSVVIIRAIFK